MSKTPFAIVAVPGLENPGAGPSTPLNVPLMRVDVMLVMMTEPLLPGPIELHVVRQHVAHERELHLPSDGRRVAERIRPWARHAAQREAEPSQCYSSRPQ